MNTSEKQMTHEESLALIQSMINTARNKFAEDGFQFLLWGTLVIIASLVNFILVRVGYADKAGLAWLLMPLVGVPLSFIYERRKAITEKVETVTDQNVGHIWISYGVTLFFLIFYSCYIGTSPIPFILLLTGMATFSTGLTLRFKPLIAGGVAFWIIAIVSFFTDPAIHLLLNILAISIGYIIPGIMLRRHAKLNANV